MYCGSDGSVLGFRGSSATNPLASALLSRAWGHRERIAGWRLVGLAAGFAGVVALLGLDVAGSEPLLVAKLALVVVCYSLGPLIIARSLSDLPTLEVLAASLALCAVLYAPAGIVLLPRAVPGLQVFAAVAGLGVVCTALAFVLFFRLVAEIGPVRASVICPSGHAHSGSDAENQPRWMPYVVQDGLARGRHVGGPEGILPRIEIARVVGKARRGDLQADAVSLAEDRPGVAERDGVLVGLPRLDQIGRRLRPLAQAGPHDPIEDVVRDAVEVHVDELGGEVRVRGRRAGPELHLDRPDRRQVCGQRRTSVDEHIVAELHLRLILRA